MKRILMFCLMCLVGFNAMAQYREDASGLPYLSVKYGKLWMGNAKLDDVWTQRLLSDINGVDYTQQWDKAVTGYWTGMGLTIGGGVLAYSGICMMSLSLIQESRADLFFAFTSPFMSSDLKNEVQQDMEDGKSSLKARSRCGAYITYAGLAVLAAGVPTMCIYKGRLQDIAGAYNSDYAGRHETSLTFGGQQHGLGFSLRF